MNKPLLAEYKIQNVVSLLYNSLNIQKMCYIMASLLEYESLSVSWYILGHIVVTLSFLQ